MRDGGGPRAKRLTLVPVRGGGGDWSVAGDDCGSQPALGESDAAEGQQQASSDVLFCVSRWQICELPNPDLLAVPARLLWWVAQSGPLTFWVNKAMYQKANMSYTLPVQSSWTVSELWRLRKTVIGRKERRPD